MSIRLLTLFAGFTAALAPFSLAAQSSSQDNLAAWPLLQNPFESTGGGGVMIDGYKPVVEGAFCRTDFSVKEPEGKVYENSVEFDALAVQGGILCTNGRWRAKDGSAQGTTPFRVFIRDGVTRRSP